MRSKNIFFFTQKKARQGMLKFTFFKDAEKGIDCTTVQNRNILYSVYYTDINAQNHTIYHYHYHSKATI